MTMRAHRVAGIALLLALAAVPHASAQSQSGPAYVTRVVDGVTIYAEIGGRLETIRYLGVQVPRIDLPTYGSEPYALAAREANRRLVEGRWIRLLFDAEPRDRYGRLQAWVWRDDVFVNGTLAHRGWVEAAPVPRYLAYFQPLEQAARQAGRGLWRDRAALAFHRPQSADSAAEDGESERAADASGGRVFSAPAPFAPVPAGPSRTTGPAAVSAPSAPRAPSAPSAAPTGGMGSSTPSRSTPRGRY